MMAIDERYACARCGLSPDGGYLTHLSNCPDWGSSDCPVAMGHEEGERCESCCSEKWYEELRRILTHRAS